MPAEPVPAAESVATCLVCGQDCGPWSYSLSRWDMKTLVTIEPFCSRTCLNDFALERTDG